MRIHSFIPPDLLQTSDRIELPPDEAHHLARVLRVQSGQALTLFDGQGIRADAAVEAVCKKSVSVRITGREQVPPPPVEITLIQAVCKPDRFEIILQKAVELGVRHIIPVDTQNTALPAAKLQKLAERGEAILRNAAQQCDTAWLPTLQPLKKVADVFPALNRFDAVFIGSLHPGARPFRAALQTREKSSIRTVALLIGPEGDFTKEEADTAVAAGAIPVTFGRQILRTETAAIFGLSVLTYELF